MSPRIATGLAALAAFVAAGSAPAWADAPEGEPSAPASASASPTAERSPFGPSASPSASPSPSPSPDASPSTEQPREDDGADAREPSPDMDASQDGGEASPGGGGGADDDAGEDGDADGDSGDQGAEALELEGPDPDELGDHVAELDYVCTLPNGRGTEEQTFLWSAWAVPENPTEGRTVRVGAVFAGDYSWLIGEDDEIIEADAVTETGTVELGGRAAPRETMDFTVRATRGEGPFGLEWDFGGASAETTPERAGALTFTPGAVRMVVEAEGDKAVTDCAPATSVDPLLELKVAEDDTGGGADGGSGGGGSDGGAFGGGGDRAAEGNGRTISTPLGDLPVTGPALLGLAGAGAVSLGAGSMAMYLARKRPGVDD